MTVRNNPKLNKKGKRGLFIKFFLSLFLPVAVVLAVLFGLFYVNELHSINLFMNAKEQNSIEITGERLENAFHMLSTDLMVVAGHSAMGGVYNGDPKAIAELKEEFSLFAANKHLYEQIRYIDETGRERIRLNYRDGTTSIVPDAELQNKFDRYYFKEGMELSPGDVYYSALDLNVEHGTIEMPHRPVLRAVTLVYDNEAVKRGVLILNYSAGSLIERIKKNDVRGGSSLMLLNSEGYWVAGGKKGDDFAFLFKGREGRSFGRDYPEAWERINHGSSGQFIGSEGMFTFATFDFSSAAYRMSPFGKSSRDNSPSQYNIGDTLGRSAPSSRYWKVISYMSLEAHYAYARSLRLKLILVYLGVMLVAAVISWVYGATRLRRESAEDALASSEKRFQEMMDNSTAVVSVKDVEGRYQFVNKAFENIFQIKSADVVGRTDHDVFSVERADIFRANDLKAINKRAPVELEVAVNLDGEPHTYITLKFPLLDSGGRPYAVCSISTDITARKEVEDELRKSRQKIALHFDQTPLAVIEWNTSFEVVGWNPAAERIFGFAAEEAIGRHAAGLLVHESVKGQIDLVWQDLLANRGGHRSTNDNITKDGKIIICEWYNTPLVDSMGEVIGVSSLVMDITERRKTEDALEASRKMLVSVIDTIPVRVFWKDKDMKYLGCNTYFARDAGFESPDELIGKDDFQMSWKNEAELYQFDDKAVMDSGEVKLNYEEPQSRPDGKMLWLSTSKVPLRDREGNVFGLLGTYEDITERKQTEQALETLYKSTGGSLGQEFFDGVVESLYDWLGADCVIVGEKYDGENIRTLSMKFDGKKVEDFSYALPGSPCAEVIDGAEICIFPEDVAGLFPYDEILTEMGAVGYVGTILKGKDDAPIGVLCVLTRNKLVLPPDGVEVLELVAARASSELERMRAEQEVLKVNRALKAISECNEALVHASGEQALLVEICRIIIDTGGYRMVWVGFAEHDAQKSVRPVARAGFDAGYVDALTVSWADNVDGQGPVGVAIRSEKFSVVRNLSTDPRFEPWREEAAKRGYASAISLPLMDNKVVLGTLNIYAGEVDAFNDEETALLMELAKDLAYGIATLRAQEERRKAEDAATHLGLILEESLNEIYIIDVDSLKFIQANRGARRNIGYTMEELKELTPIDIKPEISLDDFTELTKPLRNGEKEFIQFRSVHKRKDGTTYPVDIYIQLSAFESRPVYVAIILDITERVKAEQEVKSLTESLERQVSERTSELQAVNKELEAFAYSVSHDLRAPLRGIDGFSQALIEDYGEKLDGDAQDYLRRIRVATQHMGELIKDMLLLSRVTRNELRREVVDVSSIARRIGEELKRTSQGRSVEFVVEAAMEARDADSHMVKVVLENLIENAWKFTAKKDNAKIEFGSIIKSGEQVFYIRDNGAGFDMAYAGKLFGAFQRLHSVEEFEGTGIGLATVQRIVHRHGGRIWAEAEVDCGACFYFTLRLAED